MKVKLHKHKLMAGPDGVKPGGSVVELPEEHAQHLIDSGQAEAMEEEAKALPQPLPKGGEQEVVTRETAVLPQAQNREKRGSKARNRSNS